MASLDKLTEKYPISKQNVRLVNHYDIFDTLTPAHCFSVCKESVRCAAASFTTDTRWSHNCLLFKKGAYHESNEDVELWISYGKVSIDVTGQTPVTGGNTLVINNLVGNTIGSHNSQVENTNSGNVNGPL
jgi:predicted membrane protein